MNIQLNVNFTVVFDGKRTQADDDIALNRLETAISRIQAKFPSSVTVGNQNAPKGTLEANTAYRDSFGYGRTPKVTDKELALRQRLPDVNWTSLQSRHEALLTLGYDVFNVNRDKEDGASSAMPQDSALPDGVSFDDIPEGDE
jgi:hypothetical protein